VTIALFDPAARAVVIGLAVAAAAVGLALAGRPWPRVRTLAWCALFAALGLLAAEALVADRPVAAPRAADFNEHRWVLLAPWRRPGLALGGRGDRDRARSVGAPAGAPRRCGGRPWCRCAPAPRSRRWWSSSSRPSSCARSRASPTGWRW
jgi:hypothetical protein